MMMRPSMLCAQFAQLAVQQISRAFDDTENKREQRFVIIIVVQFCPSLVQIVCLHRASSRCLTILFNIMTSSVAAAIAMQTWTQTTRRIISPSVP